MVAQRGIDLFKGVFQRSFDRASTPDRDAYASSMSTRLRKSIGVRTAFR